MAQSETITLTAQVPLLLAEKLDQFALRLDRTSDSILKQALSDWIVQEEKRSLLTREAMDDVDAGRFIDHLSVQAWSDSLSTDKPLPVPR